VLGEVLEESGEEVEDFGDGQAGFGGLSDQGGGIGGLRRRDRSAGAERKSRGVGVRGGNGVPSGDCGRR
jgi:hypothetical protein